MATKAAKGCKKIGRGKRTGRYTRYRSSGRLYRNKLKRVLHSNGPTAAKAYAAAHNLQPLLARLSA